jgi:hypothetical protein
MNLSPFLTRKINKKVSSDPEANLLGIVLLLFRRHNRIYQQLQTLIPPPLIDIKPIDDLHTLRSYPQQRLIHIKGDGIDMLA